MEKLCSAHTFQATHVSSLSNEKDAVIERYLSQLKSKNMYET